ncbi:MAG: ABC transporter ATP-binding protein [bacterium]
MSDPNDSRKITRNWREYLGEIRESYRVYTWVWQELIGVDAKRILRKMGVALTIEIVFALSIPFFISMVFNGLVAGDHRRAMTGLGLALVALLFERFAAHFVMIYREWIVGFNQGELDERANLLFLEKSMGQHSQENSVLSSSNVEKGRARVFELENMMLFEGLHTIIMLAISYTLLWFISPVAGIVMTVMIGIIFSWSMFMNRKVLQICTPLDADFRKLNRHRVERWDQVGRVKANAKEREEVKHMRGWFNQILDRDRHFWFWYIKNLTGRGTLTSICVMGILTYGVWLVRSGVWEVGLLYPLFTWSVNLKDNLWRVGNIEHQLNWNMPSVRSMIKALTMEPDVVDADDSVDLADDAPVALRLCNVSHGYPDSEGVVRKVLQDVSFTVGQGEKVALLGPSGAGKTTIMRVIMRHMDPNKGAVHVNGQNLKSLKLASWLEKLGYIAQEPAVLDGTIRYNLLYSLPMEDREKVSDADLWKLMGKLQIDFGDRLSEGLDTKVGRDGVKLSGGEKQRVMIGAAAIKQPKLMVIDEATSSLDALTERKVHDGLKEVLTDDMSALIITHRLNTVRDICDKFVVLKPSSDLQNGESQVEAIAGSFEELYRASPTFRELADEQGVAIDHNITFKV